MFDRKKIKALSKAQLKGNYLIPILAAATIAALLLIVWFTMFSLIGNGHIALYVLFTFFAFVVFAVSGYAYIFLGFRIILKAPEEKLSFSDFTNGFSLVRQAVAGSFRYLLFIYLWMLAIFAIIAVIFIILAVIFAKSVAPIAEWFLSQIPQISLNDYSECPAGVVIWCFILAAILEVAMLVPLYIKMIQYSLIPEILVENRQLSAKKAMRLSIKLTKGNKGKIFVLGLSFIGWYLLVMIVPMIFICLSPVLMEFSIIGMMVTSAIGMIFLSPYLITAGINAYRSIKDDAIASGRIKPEDFQP